MHIRAKIDSPGAPRFRNIPEQKTRDTNYTSFVRLQDHSKMENVFIQHLRIENTHLRTAVRTLLGDVLENVESLDFSHFRGDMLASAFYNPRDIDDFTNLSTKLKTFVDDHVSNIQFAMGMSINSTRPVESIIGFDWDAIFHTIRGLQTGSDQSYSMAMLASTILSQVGKRDFLKSPRRDTVESDLKHAVGAVLVLKTLKLALMTPPPGTGTPDDPITYYHIFVDRVLRRFHDLPVVGQEEELSSKTFTAQHTFLAMHTTPHVKPYDNPPELRSYVEKIVHRVFFAAAQVLLTDRRFLPNAIQFMKWSQYVVLPMYMVRVNPLAAKPSMAPSVAHPPVVVASATFVTVTPLLSTAPKSSPAIQPVTASKLPKLTTTTSAVGAGIIWDIPSVRPATATPSPRSRPRSVTPSKIVLNAAAAAENF